MKKRLLSPFVFQRLTGAVLIITFVVWLIEGTSTFTWVGFSLVFGSSARGAIDAGRFRDCLAELRSVVERLGEHQ